jgi:glycine/D-amino acid oxidase-like deaminating enzyme
MTATASDRGAGREIAIVGAGAVGLTTAYDLARQSADVTVYERGPVASGSSGRAAGVCYDAFASRTDTILGREALARFNRFAEHGAPFQPCPYVWLAQEGDTEHAEAIQEGIERMQEFGIDAVHCTPELLGELFPSLRVDDVAVAGVTEGAGYTDTGRYTEWLATTAERAGATLETHTPVEIATSPPRVVHEDGTEREVDSLVVAAGAHSKRLLADTGVAIPMKPYRVQALVGQASVTEPMWYDTTAACYARPHPDGLLAGNGTEEREADPDEYDRTADDGFASHLARRVTHRLPDISFSVRKAWAGLCTATPDRNPLVGELRDGLYAATGFQGQGFMRSPAIGRRLANQVLGDDGLDPYDPTRFSGDEEFSIREGMAIEP